MLEAVIAYHDRQLQIALSVVESDGNMFTPQQRDRALLDASNHRAFLASLKAAQREIDGDYPLLMHRKRGSTYSEVGVLIVQSERPVHDNDQLVLYRGRDGKWFGRPEEEFRDGRFAEVETASDPT